MSERNALTILSEPAAEFWIVVDLNQQHSWFGPYTSESEGKYKAAELASTSPGPKPVGLFKYVGGASREHKPVYWHDPSSPQKRGAK